MSNTLIHDLEHHAKDKATVAYAIAMVFATVLNPKGWQVMHGGKGNNSWRIYRERKGQPTEVWFFTGYDTDQVLVRNDYWWKHATQRVTLKTRRDVIRWARGL